MTNDQAKQRAERLVEKLNRLRADIQGGYETADSPVTIIAAELLAVQRLERERCAKIVETKASNHSESRRGSPFLRNTTVEMLFRLAQAIRGESHE